MLNNEARYLIIIMGVSGCGKSSFAEILARAFRGCFVEADDFHSEQCKQMMQDGVALTDALREPWIDTLCAHIQQCETSPIFMAYSGLRRSHRQRFRELGYRVVFIWLDGSEAQIAARLHGRNGHFMAASLLNSQFDSLQLPENEDDIYKLDISLPKGMLVNKIKLIIENRFFL